MKANLQRSTDGFSIVETLLILVIVGMIAGVGAYVLHQRKANDSLGSSTSSTKTAAQTGTTGSIDQLTQQDAQTETSASNSADPAMQQDATSSNSAVSNVGGAYNESNL